MRLSCRVLSLLLPALATGAGAYSAGSDLPVWQFDGNSAQSAWASPENPNGDPGGGARSNHGAKGRPFVALAAHSALTLLDVPGPGIVRRLWITLSERSPQMLRAVRIEMYWDGAAEPAVSVPLGDFFGNAFGITLPLQSAWFMNPEGRSFVANVPMPFRSGARIVLVNDSGTRVSHIYYDVDYQRLGKLPADALYFHAYWHHEPATRLGEDFVLLPEVAGRGRYMGALVEVATNPAYGDAWWGEGELKAFIDEDRASPTLAGTGTEDYFGTAYGLGVYQSPYSGCPVAGSGRYACYRLHIPDPVFFAHRARVTLQQIGGDGRDRVMALQEAGVPLVPVSIDDDQEMRSLYEPGKVVHLKSAGLPDGWLNFYRSDDVAAVAYFYLDAPVDHLPRGSPPLVE
jgi:hypothetical protein